MLSWNRSNLGQGTALPKLRPGHLYRARWVASVPCATLDAGAKDAITLAIEQLGFDLVFATVDQSKLYGRTPPWPDSRKGVPDEAGPLNCAVYTEHRWNGPELSFLPDVFANVPGLRIWDLWDEDADPVERDLIRRGEPVNPLPLPPVPPIVPPAAQPPVVKPPPAQAPAKSSLAWLWLPVIGVTGLIFAGTLRPAR